MAAPIEPGKAFRSGQPRGLFDGAYNSGIESGRSYDVNPASGRFLLVKPADEGSSTGTSHHGVELDVGFAGSVNISRERAAPSWLNSVLCSESASGGDLSVVEVVSHSYYRGPDIPCTLT